MNNSSESLSAGQWLTILHLSQLANFLIPFAGIIVPVVIWQAKKDQIAGVDEHGKMIVNWLISSFIYGVVFLILAFVFIGIPLLFVLGLLAVGFPIYGAIKASEGVLWAYPLSMRFIK